MLRQLKKNITTFITYVNNTKQQNAKALIVQKIHKKFVYFLSFTKKISYCQKLLYYAKKALEKFLQVFYFLALIFQGFFIIHILNCIFFNFFLLLPFFLLLIVFVCFFTFIYPLLLNTDPRQVF